MDPFDSERNQIETHRGVLKGSNKTGVFPSSFYGVKQSYIGKKNKTFWNGEAKSVSLDPNPDVKDFKIKLFKK